MTGPPALQVENLRVRANGRLLLAVEALRVPSGTALAVAGPSGAGKSTLLNALAGMAPQGGTLEGSVLWGGRDVVAMSEAERTRFRERHVGLVFQDFPLFEELDAHANAALAALWRPRRERAALRARAARTLERLGVPCDARGVATFSGGERQRVALARALAHDPPILLADEPTASLDRPAGDRLIADLLALLPLRTLVVVSHDERFHRALPCTRIADGRLVEAT